MSTEIEDIYETPHATPDLKTELARKLQELIPEAITDGKVDVTKLKELLGDDAGSDSERFGLFWPGKRIALRAAQEPTTATLRPDRETSKDWDTTNNVFIEGDNLEVLKILQKHYHGKIKMIYIDPPYNTGKDFVYPDNYREGLATYLEWTRQVNEEGKRLSTNSESEGRYHSNWLNMMYPRLKLARNLLTQDGVIFVSIDYHEEPHLRKVMDEVFGETNFLNDLTWVVNLTGRQISGLGAARTSETILAYARNAEHMQEFFVDIAFAKSEMPDAYKGFTRDVRRDQLGEYAVGDTLWNHNRIFNEETRANLVFSIFYNPSTSDIKTGDIGASFSGYVEILPHKNGDGRHKFHAWRWSRGKVDNEKHDLIVESTRAGGYEIFTKIREFSRTVLKDLITNIPNGVKETTVLFEGKKLFDYPKPVDLLKLLIASIPTQDAVILDFFAGSGTTAHAVMALNSQDGGQRKWIQVQLPEPTPEGSAAREAGYTTITELARKRITLAGQQVRSELTGQKVDVGFRSYTLVDTNFTKWRMSSDVHPGTLEQLLLDLLDTADDSAIPEALLTEILLKQGYSLTEQVETKNLAGLPIQSVGDGLLLAYLDEHTKPKLEQLRAVVEAQPGKVVILDDAFQGDDELKTNIAQLCKSRAIELWTA